MEFFKKTKEKSLLIKILKLLEAILMIIIFFISTVIVVQRVTSNEYAFLGFRIFRVETGSMIPKYNIGDVILVKEVDLSVIEVEDDLVYNGEKGETKGKVITHQVIRKEKGENGEDIFYTKGINNKKEDPAVYERQVIGVVQQKLHSVTLIGNLLLYIILNKYTLYFIIILPLTIYIFFKAVYGKEKDVRAEIRERNKKAQEKEEKERKKKRERALKNKQQKLGTREIKRLGDKETEKEIQKTEKKETKKSDKSKRNER